MSDDYKVQMNIKVGETLINLRGDTVAEVLVQKAELDTAMDSIGETMSLIKQMTMAKGLTGFTPATSTATSNGAQNTASAAGATAGGLRCKHGAFKDFKGKTKKNGDPYQFRYYCPAPFGATDSCKPGALPGQEPWSA